MRQKRQQRRRPPNPFAYPVRHIVRDTTGLMMGASVIGLGYGVTSQLLQNMHP